MMRSRHQSVKKRKRRERAKKRQLTAFSSVAKPFFDRKNIFFLFFFFFFSAFINPEFFTHKNFFHRSRSLFSLSSFALFGVSFCYFVVIIRKFCVSALL